MEHKKKLTPMSKTDTTPNTTLIAAVGLSPAVLTETLWALAHSEERILPERVIVLTTQTGRRRLIDWMGQGAEGRWARFKSDLEQSLGVKLGSLLRFGASTQSIRVIPDPQYERDLEDIQTPEDNWAAAEYFLEVCRSFTEGMDSRLLVSIAGGRKTMGALLHSVMTLVGRTQDRILHVLVSTPWERYPEFTHPGCAGAFKDHETGAALDSAAATLTLAEVPFIPLRYLFERDLNRTPHNYRQLMNRLRSAAAGNAPSLSLRFEPELGYVQINESSLILSAGEYALWLAFAQHRIEEQAPLEALADIGPWFSAVCERYERPGDYAHWTHRVAEHGTIDFSEIGRRWLSSIRQKLRSTGFGNMDVERIVPRAGRFSIELPTDTLHIITTQS